MSFSESILTAVFLLFFVFFVLILLMGLIKLFSLILGKFSKPAEPIEPVAEVASSEITPREIPKDAAFGGVLKLQDVDEPTAAMIMAIVSDESGIPLSELRFNSIKALPKNSKEEHA